jgi:quercetin dioxygenase-like cupin family protein
MSALDEYMLRLKAMKSFDPDTELPDHLVIGVKDAFWLDPKMTGNPCKLGVLPECPARAMELVFQELPAGEATDLQRHPHESIHFAYEGSGYSEIGEQTVRWAAGDLVYTPPWAWHRHYNDGEADVRMLLIENSGLLGHLGINKRESAGLMTYDEFKKGGES